MSKPFLAQIRDYRIQGILPGQENPSAIEVSAHGSGSAFSDLVDGICDVGMSSRAVKLDEITKGTDAGLGNMTSRACENVVGLDGVAVIVNPANLVDRLKIDQVRDIYSGKISDWAKWELGPERYAHAGTPISSFHSSGFAAMKSRIRSWQRVSWRT